MSGCPSKVGRKGTIDRYISRRSQCNQKYCGPVYYHGVIWNWNAGQCVAKAPRGQSFNSGVGTKVGNPRFACNKTCATNLDPLTAVRILQGYLKAKYNGQGSLILVAPKETLESDHADTFCPNCDKIQHYDPSHPEYYTLPPRVRAAADAINNLGISAPLKKGGPSIPHIAGYESYKGQAALAFAETAGFGFPIKFGPAKDDTVLVFGCSLALRRWLDKTYFRTHPDLCGVCFNATPFGSNYVEVFRQGIAWGNLRLGTWEYNKDFISGTSNGDFDQRIDFFNNPGDALSLAQKENTAAGGFFLDNLGGYGGCA